MPATLADHFLLQLSQQASLYDLTYMTGRALSREQVENLYFRMLEVLPVTTTLELGAHEATFSRMVKEKFPTRTARAFEANPQVYSHFFLKGDIERCGVDYIHTAVGAENGSTAFYIYDQLDGKEEARDSRRQSLLLRTDTQDAHYTAVWVPQARLDTLCSADDASARYGLWIDVEGAAGLVLDGAEETLKKTLLVYIELESIPKFAGQSLDRDILSRLLDADFLPVARDFQFRHQYNVLFVRKECLPQVEHLWHRFLQESLRRSLRRSFKLEHQEQKHTPMAPQPLPRLHFASVQEVREAMDRLPLLRAPRVGLDPRQTVVACDASDLDEAIAFYRQRLASLPAFHVRTIAGETRPASRADVAIHDFAELDPGMDIQLYFRQGRGDGSTPYAALARSLKIQGISRFSIERFCTERFFRRHKCCTYDSRDWDTIRQFANALSDAESQYTYLAVCRAALEAEPGYIPMAGYKQYFHPCIPIEPGDIICEGGCFADIHDNKIVSSTTLQLWQALKGNGRLVGFEPVADTCRRLQDAFASCTGIHLEQKALWSATGNLLLTGEGASASTESASSGEGNCPCVAIDDYFTTPPLPSVIKLDVEGAESDVLQGAQRTLKEGMPKLLLSIYHSRRGMDWIALPRMMLEADLPYVYYCGHHRPWFSETVMYAKKRAS